eukprot:1284340-Rhodomonas_salina.3
MYAWHVESPASTPICTAQTFNAAGPRVACVWQPARCRVTACTLSQYTDGEACSASACVLFLLPNLKRASRRPCQPAESRTSSKYTQSLMRACKVVEFAS